MRILNHKQRTHSVHYSVTLSQFGCTWRGNT